MTRGDRIAVLSPHLDDAVLSLGASISKWTRDGAGVRVVTVLGGDPSSSVPAGPWDARSGFATEGDAARARRVEDKIACRAVGAEPLALDLPDGQYPRRPDDDDVWARASAAIGDAGTVLSPGFPLTHPDHVWIGMLALERRDAAWRFGLYVEQPYAIGSGRPRDQRARFPFEPAFRPIAASWIDRRRKRRALLAYRSQHAQLAEVVSGTWGDLQRRIAALERRRGGEMVAWVE